MAVFTLPALNVVFKVIKDRFAPPKNTTRQAVMDKYHFVFVRDRVGRLADAQEFAQLEFPSGASRPTCSTYLLRVAGRTVQVAGDRVVIRHLYTERRVIPLNLFLRDADARRRARRGARLRQRDQGPRRRRHLRRRHAAQKLRHHPPRPRHLLRLRRALPALRVPFPPHSPPRTLEEEFAAEPWFPVGEHDVFPEEFSTFLVPSGALRDAFLAAHGDLLRVEYWQAIQQAPRGRRDVRRLPLQAQRAPAARDRSDWTAGMNLHRGLPEDCVLVRREAPVLRSGRRGRNTRGQLASQRRPSSVISTVRVDRHDDVAILGLHRALRADRAADDRRRSPRLYPCRQESGR